MNKEKEEEGRKTNFLKNYIKTKKKNEMELNERKIRIFQLRMGGWIEKRLNHQLLDTHIIRLDESK